MNSAVPEADLARERAVAVEAVRAAAAYCRQVRRTMVTDALTKSDRSPVTIADFGVQAIVCRRVHEAFADDAIVAEERSADLLRADPSMADRLCRAVRTGFDPSADLDTIAAWIDAGETPGTGRRWVLDPVDGTKGFLRGEQYAIALALLADGQVQLGVLGCPSLPASDGGEGCLFVAEQGRGAAETSLDGPGEARPVCVSAEAAGPELRFVESVESGHADHGLHGEVARRLGITRPAVRYDSQAKYAVVARGEASAYLRLPNPGTPEYREKLWDHAAGWLLVAEAGGRTTDAFGKPLDFAYPERLEANRGAIVTNGACHAEVVEAVRAAMGEAP